MNAKKQKLETQVPSVDIQSSIFKGISVFVNGYTGMNTVKVALTFHYFILGCVIYSVSKNTFCL